MRSRLAFGFIVAAFCMAAGAARPAAHHSFSAEFDEKNCAELTGKLVGVDWQNPHPYFFVEGKNQKGQVGEDDLPDLVDRQHDAGRHAAGLLHGEHEQGRDRARVRVDQRHRQPVRGVVAQDWSDGPLHRTGQDVERIFGSNN